MIKAKKVHCIGAGGIGVSAVAKWWQAQGAEVTGSDVAPSTITEDLIKRGIQVAAGQHTDNVPEGCDLVIYSRAVPEDNPERQAAQERGITELSFAQFLGELAKDYKTIAVSGTNGKSTTSSMIGQILVEAGLDPTIIIGSQSVDFEDGNLRVGEGDWLVVEACEHMASMLEVKPKIAVVTNIEPDHLDFYRDLDHIKKTFQTWVDGAEVAVINETDPNSADLKAKEIQTFNIEKRKVGEGEQSFKVKSSLDFIDGEKLTIKLPGEYNAMNASAAAVAATAAKVSAEAIKKGLLSYKGIWRRFEHVGEWQEADVYSDYAHHPTAIQGALKAFKEFYPERRLVLCYEPHQHSRTKELFDEFVESFDLVDALILSEIYGVAGRTEDESISSNDLAEKIKARKTINYVKYAQNHDEAESLLRDVVQKDDIVVIMGAGTIDNLARKLAV